MSYVYRNTFYKVGVLSMKPRRYNEGTCDPDRMRYAWHYITYRANGKTVEIARLLT